MSNKFDKNHIFKKNVITFYPERLQKAEGRYLEELSVFGPELPERSICFPRRGGGAAGASATAPKCQRVTERRESAAAASFAR